MDELDVTALSANLAARIAKAKEDLRARMLAQGLELDAGWRIREEMRSSVTGTLFVLRPVHLKLDDPGLEETVAIGHDGHTL
jgi:hypothetical protein